MGNSRRPGNGRNLAALAILLAAGCLLQSGRLNRTPEVTLISLLDEMVSPEEQSRWPVPFYTCRQESSHDPRTVSPDSAWWFGNNDGYEGGNFLRIDTINGRVEKVMLDVTGPGAITRFWITSLDRRPVIRFYFDGSKEPGWVIPAYDMTQFGADGAGRGILIPHTSYSADGSGGSTSFFPVPYARGCKITIEIPKEVDKKPRYYQINYRVYEPSAVVETFSKVVAQRARQKIEDVNHQLLNPSVPESGKFRSSAVGAVKPGESVRLDLPAGQRAVYETVFRIQMPEGADYGRIMRQLIFTATFDGAQTVMAPLSDFSGGGMGAPADSSWFLTSDGKGTVISRWLMPYRKSGSIYVTNHSDTGVKVFMEVSVGKLKWDARSLYFHADWKQDNGLPLASGDDINTGACREWNFATLTGKGVYKGDILSLYNRSSSWYGEGDEKIWVDGEAKPSHLGTGTEDYYNASWAPVVVFHTPFGGAPRADSASSCGYNTFLRTRNLDGIPFQKQFRYDLELLAWNRGTSDYSSTVFWYGDLKASAATAGVPDHFSPPLGWNSYTGYSTAAPESELIKNIDAVASKLKPSGYEYVTVDNGWFLDKRSEDGGKVLIDRYGLPESSPFFFPNGVKSVIDYAHSKGLKFGIWIIRGVVREAVERNLPIEGTTFTLQDIADKKDLCGWNDFNYGVDMKKPGAQQYYNNLIKKYAAWGVDFIKFDDIVPHPDEVAAVVKAIRNCGRHIVLSLSPGDYIRGEDSHAYQLANMVRITSDIWDERGSLETSFQRWAEMQNYDGASFNSWLDMDMICFGRLYVVNDGGWLCKFTDDQKRTFMVQRAMAASPLIAGGVLYTMDDFSLSLLTHKDILACDQNGVVGKLVRRQGKTDIWKTPARQKTAVGQEGWKESGWIGVFNRDGERSTTVTLGRADFGLNPESSWTFLDIWQNKPLELKPGTTITIPADGCAFIQYTQN